MLPLDELLTAVSEEEALATFLEILESLEIPAAAWPQRGIAMTILRVFARAVSSLSKAHRAIAEAGFLDHATGAGLTLLARCVYGVERIPATVATGELTLANPTGTSFTKAAGAAIFIGENGKSYRNLSPFTLNPFSQITITVTAIEVGSASTAAAGTVHEIETTMIGVSASNAQSIVGVDEELDPSLRQACRDRIQAYGAGAPRGAYAYWARRAKRDDGAYVNTNRVSVSRSSSTGRVVVTMASPSGPMTPEDLTAVRDTIEDRVRPDTVTVLVGSAAPLQLSPSITAYAVRSPGLSASTVKAQIETALATFGAAWPIGGRTKPPSLVGYLYEDSISAAVIAAHPAIYECDVDLDDTELTALQVVVLTPSVQVILAEAL